MKKKIEIVKTGISLIDSNWGGFYRGGTYLLVGPRKSGRTLISLQFAKECVAQNESCLYFTNMRPKDLMIQASSIDFDIQSAMSQNLIVVVRASAPDEVYEDDNHDEFLTEYLNDIVSIVDTYQPSKIVFDELTPFISFKNLNTLKEAFSATTERIEENAVTTLHVVGDPATPGAKAIIDTIANESTGVLFIQKITGYTTNGENKLLITPNIGHTQGKFSSQFSIAHNKGVIFDDKNFPNAFVSVQPQQQPLLRSDSIYKPLSELNIPEENLNLSNIYTKDDFNLILNNQIALFNSTGQVFTIISFRLDEAAEKKGLLTLKQLQNAVRLSSDKKDKICTISNKVIILVIKEDESVITNIISKVKSNLPALDEKYLTAVIQFISVYAFRVNESVKNSKDIIDRVLSDEKQVREKINFFA